MSNYNLKYFQYFLILYFFFNCSLHGQLRGGHLLGQLGLQSATQGPPSINLLVLPAYYYATSKVKGDNGNVILDGFSLNSFAAAPGMAWTLNSKIFGGNIGGSFFIPFVSNKIEAADISQSSSLAFSDIFIQPLQLGWHTQRADYSASFNLYMPTGRYQAGADDNTGLGMWAYEFSAGSTLYFDKEKTWSFAALFSYEFNSRKRGIDTKAGDLLSIEGGLGKTFYKKTAGPIPLIINAGAAYYMQFKTTNDNIQISEDLEISGRKDRIYGLGPEASIYIPSIESMFDLRGIFEMGAVNRFQGTTFLVSWIYTLKSFEKTKEDK